MFFVWFFILQRLSSVTMAVSVTLVGDPLAIQGQDYRLFCLKTNLSAAAVMDWYTDGIKYAVLCSPFAGFCSPSQSGRYSFTIDNNGMYINITGLRRSEDQRLWKCTYKVQGAPLEEDTMNLTIFTITSGLNYTKEPSSSVDLSLSEVRLECVTSECIYPVPVINWYYKDTSPAGLATMYKTTVTHTTGGNCTSPENVYSSTLELPQNTTWSDNSEKTVKLSCGIEYPKPLGAVYSPDSSAITFAIRVTWVELRQNNMSISDTNLSVTSGVPVTLTCVTGTSRPDPIIAWFIGNQSKGNRTNLTFIPADMDHDKTIYCQAYNTNPNITVESAKPKMFVRVRVTIVTLQDNGQAISDNTLTVTSEEATNLTCVTGTSRPPATIEWYVGSQMMGSGTNLTFFPKNKDHDKEIFCQAYNTDPNRPVISLKPKLFVKVKVSNVTFWDSSSGTMIFYAGFPKTLKCISSPSRPVPIITWWFESQSGTIPLTNNITNTEEPAASELYVLISEITLTLMKDSRDKRIFCDGKIGGQQPVAVSNKVTVDVWYAPDINVTITGQTQENMSLSIRCEVKGVPASYTFHPWKHMLRDVLIRDNLQQNTEKNTSSSHSILKLEGMSLQDMGTYVCSADNGIKGINGQVIQNGTVDVNFIAKPVIIEEDNSLISEEVGHSVNIAIPFYSYPAIQDFTFMKNGTNVTNTSQTSMQLSTATVSYIFYSKTVPIEVQVAHLLIQNLTLYDFDNYTLLLINSVGPNSFTVQLEPAGPPMMIKRFYFNRFMENQIELHFDPGFNGGRVQTFVIEYKSTTGPDTDWKNFTDLNETQIQNRLPNGTYFLTVMQLSPGNYKYRMYSKNEIGRSLYSEEISVFIPEVTKPEVGPNVVAIVGGVAASVVVIVVVTVGFIFIKRRSYSRNRPSELNDNPVYDNSDNLQSTNAREQSVVFNTKYPLKIHEVDDSKTLYAQVDKKGSKANRKGDTYENATIFKRSKGKGTVYKNSENVSVGVPGENMYNLGKAAGKDPVVNKDDLHYADLMLDPPTTRAGKPVIHGLENHTEYADIAYGERGEHLPESDDEKENDGAKK